MVVRSWRNGGASVCLEACLCVEPWNVERKANDMPCPSPGPSAESARSWLVAKFPVRVSCGVQDGFDGGEMTVGSS